MKPLVLMILDGFGYSESDYGNAVRAAKMPNLDRIKAECPMTIIGASGMDVGLPEGQMGNSEVGHTNIGAGRIVYQPLTRITKAVRDGEFFKNPALVSAMENAKERGSALHLMGLLSDGGVHSHIEHLFALIDMAKGYGLEKVYIHCFMDGRDVPPTSGIDFVKELEAEIKKVGAGKIATVSGRYYAMDRDNRWERVVKAYEALTLGNGVKANSAEEAVENSYKNEVTDEFIVPANIYENGKPVGLVEKGDSVIFFNFRPDRAREITRAFTEEEFGGFERKTGYLGLNYVGFTKYDETFHHVAIAFKKQELHNTLGKYLSDKGYTQLRIAETEKYAHVTFFFNGGVEAPEKNEYRDLIPSPKVATYDLQPEMSAYLVTDKVLEEIASDKFDVIILNYANCDMVGHTGVLDAAVKAVKTVEDCIGKITDAVLKKGGSCIVTADHGNADKMIDTDGEPFTAHTTNRVPVILVSEQYKNVRLREDGVLADLAPTLLEMMGETIPAEMTGKSLIVK